MLFKIILNQILTFICLKKIQTLNFWKKIKKKKKRHKVRKRVGIFFAQKLQFCNVLDHVWSDCLYYKTNIQQTKAIKYARILFQSSHLWRLKLYNAYNVYFIVFAKRQFITNYSPYRILRVKIQNLGLSTNYGRIDGQSNGSRHRSLFDSWTKLAWLSINQ